MGLLPASPSVARNRAPILEALGALLGDARSVLEIASGTGEHAVWLAANLPWLTWQPSDVASAALEIIAARREAAGLGNLAPPRRLDVEVARDWAFEDAPCFDAVVAINMIHISPWSATEGLVRGAASVLRPGGLLFLYGPFHRAGHPLAASNAAFDADLQARDPAWGLRRLEFVVQAAEDQGLQFTGALDMPANNLGVMFRRS